MKETRGSGNRKVNGKQRNTNVNISVHREVWKDSMEPKKKKGKMDPATDKRCLGVYVLPNTPLTPCWIRDFLELGFPREFSQNWDQSRSKKKEKVNSGKESQESFLRLMLFKKMFATAHNVRNKALVKPIYSILGSHDHDKFVHFSLELLCISVV